MQKKTPWNEICIYKAKKAMKIKLKRKPTYSVHADFAQQGEYSNRISERGNQMGKRASYDKVITTRFAWEGPLLKVEITAAQNELGFLRRFAAILVGLNWSIVSGALLTKKDNSVEDNFYIKPPPRKKADPQQQLREVSEIINSVLSEGMPAEEILVRYKVDSVQSSKKNKKSNANIEYYDDKNQGGVVFFIETEDRRGLLYTIATVFAQNDIDIRKAVIKTISNKGRAEDMFVVLTQDGKYFGDSALGVKIRDEILKAL